MPFPEHESPVDLITRLEIELHTARVVTALTAQTAERAATEAALMKPIVDAALAYCNPRHTRLEDFAELHNACVEYQRAKDMVLWSEPEGAPEGVL